MFLLGDKLLVEVVERLRHFSQPFGLLDRQGREEMFLDFRKGLWIVLGLVRELFRITTMQQGFKGKRKDCVLGELSAQNASFAR